MRSRLNIGIRAGKVFGRLPWRIAELLLDLTHALFVLRFVGQQAQGLFQHRLQGFLIGIGQFAVGNFVQTLLNRLGGGRFGSVEHAD